jgi:hypothetical protein
VCNATLHISCEISGSHGCKYGDECLLGYSACSLFGMDRRFRDMYCLHPQFSLGVDRGLKGTFHSQGGDGAVRTSETSVYSNETTQRCIAEVSSRLHIHC